jgi:hypothetical protein
MIFPWSAFLTFIQTTVQSFGIDPPTITITKSKEAVADLTTELEQKHTITNGERSGCKIQQR